MEAGLHAVTLTTRKPPAGLAGAPYLQVVVDRVALGGDDAGLTAVRLDDIVA